MTKHDDEMFRVKPRAPKAGEGPRWQGFRSQVAQAINRAGGIRRGITAGRRSRGGKRGRGWVAARLMDSDLGSRSRRVAVKVRHVVMTRTGSRTLSSHLRYVVRDGTSRDGTPAQAFGADTDSADVKAFEERCQGDRHHFRFIVAPEDGAELGDLRAYTRELMRRMERDLETPLDWVAVDHWDTDNPHSHVVLRGKDNHGENLVIGREYISHGMRIRASEIANAWLGLRTELEIQASLRREVEQERWTGLDRELQARARDGSVDLAVDRKDPEELRRRALLIGRLQRLEAMRLAWQTEEGWGLRADAESVLRRMGERGDIIRTMQRAFGSEQRELTIGGEPNDAPMTGKILAMGRAGEHHDRPYLVIDGVDGRGHYVVLPPEADTSVLPLGGIVDVRPTSRSVADRNVAGRAVEGTYRTADHVRHLQARSSHRSHAEEIVTGHVRRLEALRRAGIVERLADGVWRIPSDLVARGEAYDGARLGNVSVKLRCHLPIEQQIWAIGATWLDQQLLDGGSMSPTGFGAAAHRAVVQRTDVLIERGLAERRDGQTFVSGKLLSQLRDRELAAVAQQIARETGLMHRPLTDGSPVSGVYRRSIMLATGRFAMLDNGLGFALVPWQPVVEKALGRSVTAVMRGGEVNWELGRQRGIGR
jgi:type IV secretory pathway VirD2 relaxase